MEPEGKRPPGDRERTRPDGHTPSPEARPVHGGGHASRSRRARPAAIRELRAAGVQPEGPRQTDRQAPQRQGPRLRGRATRRDQPPQGSGQALRDHRRGGACRTPGARGLLHTDCEPRPGPGSRARHRRAARRRARPGRVEAGRVRAAHDAQGPRPDGRLHLEGARDRQRRDVDPQERCRGARLPAGRHDRQLRRPYGHRGSSARQPAQLRPGHGCPRRPDPARRFPADREEPAQDRRLRPRGQREGEPAARERCRTGRGSNHHEPQAARVPQGRRRGPPEPGRAAGDGGAGADRRQHDDRPAERGSGGPRGRRLQDRLPLRRARVDRPGQGMRRRWRLPRHDSPKRPHRHP